VKHDFDSFEQVELEDKLFSELSNPMKNDMKLGSSALQGSIFSSETSEELLAKKMITAKNRQQKLKDLGLFSVSGPETSEESESNNNDSSSMIPSQNNIQSTTSNTKKMKALFKDDDGLVSSKFTSAERELNSHRVTEVGTQLEVSFGQDHNKNAQLTNNKSTYQEFLLNLMHPDCERIVEVLRNFLFSILGPKGDGSPPEISNTKNTSKNSQPFEYQFHGKSNLTRRFNDFLDSVIEYLKSHKFWKDQSPEELIFARDCFERYISGKIYDIAFESCELDEDDANLSKRIEILSFLTPEALDIKPELRNDLVWALATDQLKKINSYRAPSDKIKCIVIR
jgi:hypothetical protein